MPEFSWKSETYEKGNDACDRVDCVARKYFHFQFDLP